jgi:anti-sigma factor ChrR (cupin superfamily)
VSQADHPTSCLEQGLLEAFALSSLPSEAHVVVEQHLRTCSRCRDESAVLGEIAGQLAAWPAGELTPPAPLWNRLAKRIGLEGWPAIEQELSLAPHWPDLEWQQPAPGIYCKILSIDSERNRVSMLVRLDPRVDYPPHVHAGIEELHLLDGELWINDRKLYPGDFNRAEPGTSDQRVWSEIGCTCVLMTSPDDALGVAADSEARPQTALTTP